MCILTYTHRITHWLTNIKMSIVHFLQWTSWRVPHICKHAYICTHTHTSLHSHNHADNSVSHSSITTHSHRWIWWKIHSYAIHIRFRVPQSHVHFQFYANSHCLKRKHAYTFTCTEILLQSPRISQILTTHKTLSLTTHFHTWPYSDVLPHKQDKKETHHIVTTQKHANVSVHAHHPYIQWVQWNITWKMLAHNEGAWAGSHIHLHRDIHIYTHSHIHHSAKSLSIQASKYAHQVTHI